MYSVNLPKPALDNSILLLLATIVLILDLNVSSLCNSFNFIILSTL